MMVFPVRAVLSTIGNTLFSVVMDPLAPGHHRDLCAASLVRGCNLFGEKQLSAKLQAFWKASGTSFPLPSLLLNPLLETFHDQRSFARNWLMETFPESGSENVPDGGDFFDPDTLVSLLEIFQEEAREIVSAVVKIHVESLFDEKSVSELFRHAHTLKGAAATVGLMAISAEALILESYSRSLRDEKLVPSDASVIFLDFAALQFIRLIEGHPEPFLFPNGSLLTLARLCDRSEDPLGLFAEPQAGTPADFLPEPGETVQPDDDFTAILMEVFQTEANDHLDSLDRNLEKLAQGENVIQDLFRTTHTLKGAAGTVGLDYVKDVAHRLEDYFDELNRNNSFPAPSSLPFLFQVASRLRNDILNHKGDLVVIDKLLDQAREIKSRTETDPTVPGNPVNEPVSREFPDPDPGFGSRFTQVPSSQLEYLFNDAEELVLVRTQIEKSRDEFQAISNDLFLSHHTLRSFLLEERNRMTEAERLERLQEVEVELAELFNNMEHASSQMQKECKELQALSQRFHRNLVELRVTSLDLLFLKVRQSIRDASFMTGKKVEFTTSGESVELDKGVIQMLSAPLLQIARNAVAHGVETLGEREALNKQGVAKLHLSARQEGRFILFELTDDGAGIDPERIRSLLVRHGMLDEAAARKVSDEDVLDAIFLPGFTTRETADNLSGRGIGLDLVRDQIRKIGGEVNVFSRPKEGTRFQIRVPLTTVVSQALIFRLGQEFYGIPVTYVIEIHEMMALKNIEPGTRILWKRESIPIVPLHYYFGVEQQILFKKNIPIVILEHGGRNFGITVDSLIGIRDVTTKSINHVLTAIQFFSGALVSGAGTIQLMFDVSYLANLARPVFGFHAQQKRGSIYNAPRILICDDSKSVREAASRVLTDAGYHTVIVSDGWEAWNTLHNEEFDLLLTDLEMPRMNGYELVQEVKRDSLLQEIPIVVLSSRTGETSRDRVMSAGANCFVTKPIKPLVLLKSIRDFLPLEEHLVTRKICIFASLNPGKIRELGQLLSSLSIEIWGLDRFPDLPEVVEDGSTFEENAIKKAKTRARQTGLPTLADDSGLMVDALHGEPGVHSARYAGETADDRERNRLLLENMRDQVNRRARFVCVIAFCPSGSSDEVILVRGELEGSIATVPRGDLGFGYDPIFLLPDGRTMAELTLEEKSGISHRAVAFSKILPHLKQFSGSLLS